MHEIQSNMTDLSLIVTDLLQFGATSQGFDFLLNSPILLNSVSKYVCLADMDKKMIEDEIYHYMYTADTQSTGLNRVI